MEWFLINLYNIDLPVYETIQMNDIKVITIPEPNKEIKAAINSTFID